MFDYFVYIFTCQVLWLKFLTMLPSKSASCKSVGCLDFIFPGAVYKSGRGSHTNKNLRHSTVRIVASGLHALRASDNSTCLCGCQRVFSFWLPNLRNRSWNVKFDSEPQNCQTNNQTLNSRSTSSPSAQITHQHILESLWTGDLVGEIRPTKIKQEQKSEWP